MALTAKQQRFVEEYLIDLNATQAAIRAGYSQRRASEIGYQLLQKTTVSDSIKKEMDKRAERVGITQEEVIRELRLIALAEAGDEQNSHMRFGSKLKALELLGKHLGMFTERQEEAQDEGGVVIIPEVAPDE